MTIKECFKKIPKTAIDDTVVKTIERAYSKNVPEIVLRIITLFKNGCFVEGYRFLSIEEIEFAEDDLHVKFDVKAIIPMIDCGDNDFIVYNYKKKKWAMFNIVDQVSFKEQNDLQDYFA